jgi:hypothetical protein
VLERLRLGVRAGLIVAAATAGALVGFGIVRGAPMLPLNAVAHVALGSRALLFDRFDPTVTIIALALHTLSLVVWGALFALIADRARGVLLGIAAAIFTAVVYFADVHLLPERLRPGFERVLSATEVVSVYVLLALSLTLAILLLRQRDDLRRARDTGWLQNATAGDDRRERLSS